MRRGICFLVCLLPLFGYLLQVAASAAGTITAQEAQLIDAYASRELKAGQIPGLSVGIVEKGQTVYLKGYGTADTKGNPVTPDTAFIIGSVGKTFTALAIRQLVNAGMLDYDTPVQKYLPWFTLADEEAASKIKLIHLVQHTSGFSTVSGIQPYLYNPKYTLHELVQKLKKVTPVRPAGVTAEYSNLDFLILGAVIEEATGKTYEEYIQQSIFDPLGMKHTFCSLTKAKGAPLATGHLLVYGFTAPSNIPYPSGHVAAGYHYSSAADMVKYVALYLSNGYREEQSLIPENEMPKITAASPSFTPSNKRYNEYWLYDTGYPAGSGGYYGHAGGTNNFTSVMLINPVSKRAVVVLANCENGFKNPSINTHTIGNGIAAILESKAAPPPLKPDKSNTLLYLLLTFGVFVFVLLRWRRLRKFPAITRDGGVRRSVSILLLCMIDVALPLLITVGLPFYYDTTWSYFLASNPALAWTSLSVSVLLFALGIAKTVLLLKNTRKANR